MNLVSEESSNSNESNNSEESSNSDGFNVLDLTHTSYKLIYQHWKIAETADFIIKSNTSQFNKEVELNITKTYYIIGFSLFK